MTIGIIYELRFNVENNWYSFYVGRTTRPQERFKEHQRAAKNANNESTLVYQFIKNDLIPLGIEFEMNELEQYNEEDYIDQEDEHIVRLLIEGAELKNMKKGDDNWLKERQNAAKDMKKRGMTSYRKYREHLSYEEQQRKIEEANAKRIAEELAHKAWQEEQAALQTLKEATRLKNIAYAHQIAEEQRIKEEEKRLAKEQADIRKKLQEAAYAATREKNLRTETERLMREEEEYQKRIKRNNEIVEQSKIFKELINPYYDDNLDVQQYRMYAKLMAQYIDTVEINNPGSSVLNTAYDRLRFLNKKIEELS